MSGVRGTAPSVFISYSWTSEEHSDWVAGLGERLIGDGVDVVLDQWSLEDGHDVQAFMEKMVSDPTIKRVIIISDAVYAEKADGRKGGVGTETQIISKEVYDSVDQTKFVPLLRERDGQGNACLPVYLKTRKYIDFSVRDNEADAYDQLLRNIFERPRRPKPALGAAPSHIFENDGPIVRSRQKAGRFCDVVASGKGNSTAAFQDFAREFLHDFEGLRMAYRDNEKDTWCDQLRTNIGRATAHRDIFVDAIGAGAAHLPGNQFVPLCIGLLESLLPFRERPQRYGQYFRCSEDNYKLLCYELFLYSFAAFVKARQYTEARQLIDHQYIAASAPDGTFLERYDFTSFNSSATSLDEMCSQQGNQRRLSVMADLVHDRATNNAVRFTDVLQADALLWIASGGRGWFPRCMVHGASVGKLELFVRAATDSGFTPLAKLLGVSTPTELLRLLTSEAAQGAYQSQMFWRSGIATCLNLDELQHRWGAQAR